MKATETKLKGCFIFEPRVFEDARGFFFESYNKQQFNSVVGDVNFVQDNQSFSKKGVLRGLHFQKGEYAQAKLVRVLQGAVLDVAVDIREGSDTYGQYVAVELSEDNKKQLFIPRGFAHGFLVLSDTAVFSYKVDNIYSKEHESGIIYNDKDLAIEWGMPESDILVSEKDKELPGINQLYNF